MGNKSSKSSSPSSFSTPAPQAQPQKPPKPNSFDLDSDDSVRAGGTFHQSLVRERDKKHKFEKIYEVQEEIGQGGLCTIFKIRKNDAKIGGSSRPELVRRGRPSSIVSTLTSSPRIPRRSASAVGRSISSSSSSGMYFALKVFNLKLIKEDKIDQLKNEVEILKSLDHKNIIKAHETFQDKISKQLMIVMELCTGGDLHARLPYTENEVARIVKQILSAISYIHERNIVHRDIKMENIIFESEKPDAAIKVIDFGLSKKYAGSDSVLTERVGTLYSMSPETMQGIYKSKADLWSVGVCCYIMLANGEKPFDAKIPKALVAKVLLADYNFDAPVWAEISPNAKSFLAKLFSIKPDDRPSAKEAMHCAWLREASSKNLLSLGADEGLKQRVREGIIRYADSGEFRKLALNIIAKKSTTEEIIELRKVFDEFDTMNTGTITLEEFRVALSQLDYSEEDVEKIFRKVDINRTNVINYTEFLAAALETQGHIEEYRLAEAFDLMDSDDKGFISRENLRQILGLHSDEKYIEQLILEADFKKDGRISYEEFLQVFGRHTQARVSTIYKEVEKHGTPPDEKVNEVLKKHGLLRNGTIRITKG